LARQSPAAKIPFQTRIGQADRNSYVIGAGACEMLSPVWAARQDLRDYAAAAAAYRKALALKPDYAEAALNLGIVLQDGGEGDAAMRAYCDAYRLRPDLFHRTEHRVEHRYRQRIRPCVFRAGRYPPSPR
jgi:tetratricopeptide (TPR) repeat protein